MIKFFACRDTETLFNDRRKEQPAASEIPQFKFLNFKFFFFSPNSELFTPNFPISLRFFPQSFISRRTLNAFFLPAFSFELIFRPLADAPQRSPPQIPSGRSSIFSFWALTLNFEHYFLSLPPLDNPSRKASIIIDKVCRMIYLIIIR